LDLSTHQRDKNQYWLLHQIQVSRDADELQHGKKYAIAKVSSGFSMMKERKAVYNMNNPPISIECNSYINTHVSKVMERLVCDQETGIGTEVSRDWTDVNLNVQMTSANTTGRFDL
jgi:hypothetical protein